MKRLIKKGTYLFPTPTAMVSCASGDGVPNIITIAWVGVVCSEPPVVSVSIRPGRYSHGLIKKSGEFVVNIPREGQLGNLISAGLPVAGRWTSSRNWD